MTMHTKRLKTAEGSCRTNDLGHALSPRISVGFDEATFSRLSWLAADRKTPLCSVIRDAVYAYTLCIAVEADATCRMPDVGSSITPPNEMGRSAQRGVNTSSSLTEKPHG